MRKRPVPDAVIAARRRFQSEGIVPKTKVRLPILRSWQRSVERGLDMEAMPEICILPAHELREAQERNEGLVRAARGELEALFHDTGMTDGIVILTDPQGVVLLCLGKGRFARDAAGVALRAGAAWDEGRAGTNAIGTALAERHPISVLGGEHFFDTHHILSCSAVPLFGPSGAIAGVLDLTNASDVPQVHALALLTRAAEQIEHRLFEVRFRGYEQIHFHSDPYLIGSSHEGLLAFDSGCLAGANRKGLVLLGLDWPLPRSNFEELFTLEQGSVSTNPASDDCVLQTKEGKTVYARLHPQGHAHSGWAPAGDPHASAPEPAEEPQLRQIVARLLSGPLARQLDVRRVKTGHLIYGADEEKAEADGLLIVRSGRLRCFASCDGKELTLFTLDAGDAIPLHASSMFEVKKDGEIVVISGTAFRKLARQDPDSAAFRNAGYRPDAAEIGADDRRHGVPGREVPLHPRAMRGRRPGWPRDRRWPRPRQAAERGGIRHADRGDAAVGFHGYRGADPRWDRPPPGCLRDCHCRPRPSQTRTRTGGVAGLTAKRRMDDMCGRPRATA